MSDLSRAQQEGARIEAAHGSSDPFGAAIRSTRMPMLITDPCQPDNPIVFVNDAFLALTGYGRDEVVGRNCRFLQGPDTDPEAVARIRSAVGAHSSIRVDLLNYCKNGAPFWNALFMSPVKDDAGRLRYFFASQFDVIDKKENEEALRAAHDECEREVERRTAELRSALCAKEQLVHEVDHRIKNNLQLISLLIALQASRANDEKVGRALSALRERVEALAIVHRRLYQADNVAMFDVSEFAQELARDMLSASGRGDISLDLQLREVRILAGKAAPVALIVNELLTNSIRHAFRGRGGTIRIEVEWHDDWCCLDVQDDGVGMAGQELGRGTFGRTLVNMLTRQLHGSVEWDSDAGSGTRVRVKVPADG